MITSLSVHGFKSLRVVDDLKLRPVNVLIGANSSGKSNLLDFFRLLSYMQVPGGDLQRFTRWRGGANALLHDGAVTTPKMSGELHFREGKSTLVTALHWSIAPATACSSPKRATKRVLKENGFL